MARQGLIQRVAGSIKSVWTATTAYFVPNRQEFQADGARYGATYAAIVQIEQAQEFSIAVNAIARSVSSSTWKIEQQIRPEDDPKPLTDVNDSALKLLKKPNPLHNWQSWIETAIMLFIPTGNLYILKDPINLLGQPMSLWLLRSDRTRPIREDSPTSPVQGYEHYAEDGRRYVFPADRVIHLKLPNPYTDYQGLGMTTLMQMTLEMDFRSMESNINMFRQGGRLSTVIEGLEDDENKVRDIVRKIKEAHMGSENAHKVLALTGTAKLNTAAMSGQPKEADYKQTREDISRAIGGMMGVPPLFMGQLDNINRATATVQKQMFLENAVWPMQARLADGINEIMVSFNPTYRFVFPQVNVMDPEIVAVLIKNAAEAGALSPNDILEHYLQLPRNKNPNMDKHFLFGVQASIEDGGGQAPNAPAANAQDAAAAQGIKPSLPVPKPIPASTAPKPTGGLADVPKLKGMLKRIAGIKSVKNPEGRRPNKGTAAQRRQVAAIRTARPKIEKAIAPIFEKHLRAVIANAITALEKRGTPNGKAVNAGNLPGFIQAMRRAYDNTGTQAGLADQASTEYVVQMNAAAQNAASIFKVSMDGFDASDAAFANVQLQLAQRITGVDQSVKDYIGGVIQKAAADGLNPWQIANGTTDGSFPGLKNMMDDVSQEHAMLIARTETTNIQDQIHTEAFKRMGVTKLDVIGCEDFVIMPGEDYGCNSELVPTEAMPVNFHPNHNGAVVPHDDGSDDAEA